MKQDSLEIDAETAAVRQFSRIAKYLGRHPDTLREHMKTNKRLQKIIRKDKDGGWVAHRADLDAYIREGR